MSASIVEQPQQNLGEASTTTITMADVTKSELAKLESIINRAYQPNQQELRQHPDRILVTCFASLQYGHLTVTQINAKLNEDQHALHCWKELNKAGFKAKVFEEKITGCGSFYFVGIERSAYTFQSEAIFMPDPKQF